MDPKKIAKILRSVEEIILDLPDKWQEEMIEKDIDWLTTANWLIKIADYLEDQEVIEEE